MDPARNLQAAFGGRRNTVNQQILQMLRHFSEDRRSGILTCKSSEATRYLMLRDGVVVGARSTLDSERLGELLVRQGIISRQHLEDGSLFARKGKRLGETLAALGVIEEDEIAHYVAQQALEIAYNAILQAHAGADFQPSSDVAQILPEPLPVHEILLEVSRRAPTIEALISGLQREERPLVLAPGSDAILKQINLQAYEALVLGQIQSGRSVRSIFSQSPVSVEETARAIFGHLSMRIVEFADTSRDAEVDAPPIAARSD